MSAERSLGAAAVLLALTLVSSGSPSSQTCFGSNAASGLSSGGASSEAESQEKPGAFGRAAGMLRLRGGAILNENVDPQLVRAERQRRGRQVRLSQQVDQLSPAQNPSRQLVPLRSNPSAGAPRQPRRKRISRAPASLPDKLFPVQSDDVEDPEDEYLPKWTEPDSVSLEDELQEALQRARLAVKHQDLETEDEVNSQPLPAVVGNGKVGSEGLAPQQTLDIQALLAKCKYMAATATDEHGNARTQETVDRWAAECEDLMKTTIAKFELGPRYSKAGPTCTASGDWADVEGLSRNVGDFARSMGFKPSGVKAYVDGMRALREWNLEEHEAKVVDEADFTQEERLVWKFCDALRKAGDDKGQALQEIFERNFNDELDGLSLDQQLQRCTMPQYRAAPLPGSSTSHSTTQAHRGFARSRDYGDGEHHGAKPVMPVSRDISVSLPHTHKAMSDEMQSKRESFDRLPPERVQVPGIIVGLGAHFGAVQTELGGEWQDKNGGDTYVPQRLLQRVASAGGDDVVGPLARAATLRVGQKVRVSARRSQGKKEAGNVIGRYKWVATDLEPDLVAPPTPKIANALEDTGQELEEEKEENAKAASSDSVEFEQALERTVGSFSEVKEPLWLEEEAGAEEEEEQEADFFERDSSVLDLDDVRVGGRFDPTDDGPDGDCMDVDEGPAKQGSNVAQNRDCERSQQRPFGARARSGELGHGAGARGANFNAIQKRSHSSTYGGGQDARRRQRSGHKLDEEEIRTTIPLDLPIEAEDRDFLVRQYRKMHSDAAARRPLNVYEDDSSDARADGEHAAIALEAKQQAQIHAPSCFWASESWPGVLNNASDPDVAPDSDKPWWVAMANKWPAIVAALEERRKLLAQGNSSYCLFEAFGRRLFQHTIPPTVPPECIPETWYIDEFFGCALGGYTKRLRRLLAEAPVHVNERGEDVHYTALHLTAVEGRYHTARALLAAGADVGAADLYGETPLHLAAYNAHVDLMKLFLVAGADSEVQNDDGLTPLDTALEELQENTNPVTGETLARRREAVEVLTLYKRALQGMAPMHASTLRQELGGRLFGKRYRIACSETAEGEVDMHDEECDAIDTQAEERAVLARYQRARVATVLAVKRAAKATS